ncbi:hypothetical protein [Azospirillum argentinense]|nr:hypothetical protein [Azospirillum argentinense]
MNKPIDGGLAAMEQAQLHNDLKGVFGQLMYENSLDIRRKLEKLKGEGGGSQEVLNAAIGLLADEIAYMRTERMVDRIASVDMLGVGRPVFNGSLSGNERPTGLESIEIPIWGYFSGNGWHGSEWRDGTNHGFRWSSQAIGTVEAPLLRERDLVVEWKVMKCVDGLEPHRLSVVVNNRKYKTEVADDPVSPDEGFWIRAVLPPDALLSGRVHQIGIHAPVQRRPSDFIANSKDDRMLAVAVISLAVYPRSEPAGMDSAGGLQDLARLAERVIDSIQAGDAIATAESDTLDLRRIADVMPGEVLFLLFQKFADRVPTREEFALWCGRLRGAGAEAANVLNGLVKHLTGQSNAVTIVTDAADEGKDTGVFYHMSQFPFDGDLTEAISLAYRRLLKREADDSGLRSYMEELTSGSVTPAGFLHTLQFSGEARDKGIVTYIDGANDPSDVQSALYGTINRLLRTVADLEYELASLRTGQKPHPSSAVTG